MAYTPELNRKHSATLRRIAWAPETPLIRAMADILDYIGRTIDGHKVCESCRDDSFCGPCPFTKQHGGIK